MSSLGHLTAVLRRNPLRLWSKTKPKGPGQGNAPAVHRKVQVNPHTAASVVQGTQEAHGNCRLSCTGRISRSSLGCSPFPQSHHPGLGVPPPTPSHFLLRQEVDQAISILYAIHRAWEAKVGCPRASPSLYFQVHSRAWMIEIMITTPSAGIRKMSHMVPNYKCCKVFKCAWQWETLAVIWVNSLTFMPQFFYLTLLSLLHVYLQPPFLFTCLFLLRSKLDLSLDFKNLSRLRSRQIQDDEHRPQVPGDPSTNKHEGEGL